MGEEFETSIPELNGVTEAERQAATAKRLVINPLHEISITPKIETSNQNVAEALTTTPESEIENTATIANPSVPDVAMARNHRAALAFGIGSGVVVAASAAIIAIS